MSVQLCHQQCWPIPAHPLLSARSDDDLSRECGADSVVLLEKIHRTPENGVCRRYGDGVSRLLHPRPGHRRDFLRAHPVGERISAPVRPGAGLGSPGSDWSMPGAAAVLAVKLPKIIIYTFIMKYKTLPH